MHVIITPLSVSLITNESYPHATMSDPSFEIGETVVDREDAQTSSLVAVSLPAPTAEDWLTYGGTSVAHGNPGYPADARLGVVVAAADLDRYVPEWDAETPLSGHS